jgi:hypothetical protein
MSYSSAIAGRYASCRSGVGSTNSVDWITTMSGSKDPIHQRIRSAQVGLSG